jgi:hypothetical protein
MTRKIVKRSTFFVRTVFKFALKKPKRIFIYWDFNENPIFQSIGLTRVLSTLMQQLINYTRRHLAAKFYQNVFRITRMLDIPFGAKKNPTVLAGFFFRAKFHSNSLYGVKKKVVGISQYAYFSGQISPKRF